MLVNYYRTTRDGRLAWGKGGGPIPFAGRVRHKLRWPRAPARPRPIAARSLLPVAVRSEDCDHLVRAGDPHGYGPALVRPPAPRARDPVRPRLYGKRRRPQLSGWTHPRVARTRSRRRMGRTRPSSGCPAPSCLPSRSAISEVRWSAPPPRPRIVPRMPGANPVASSTSSRRWRPPGSPPLHDDD